MFRKSVVVFAVLVMALVLAIPAFAGAPNFGPAIFADGEAFGTKGLGALPAPNGRNDQSFDKLFMFVNGADGQLAVAEAAPGNPDFNGGRWAAYTVEWTEEGLAAHDPLPVLMSYDEVMLHESLGHLSITQGAIGDGPDYFECPLLPVK